MATVYVYWYDAGQKGTFGESLQIEGEEVARESVTTSATAASTGAAPERAKIAVLYSSSAHHYRVNADADTSSRVQRASYEAKVYVNHGDTISVRTA